MQKSKKLLAVLLSLVLALSTMSVAMVAFAAEPAEKPVESFLGKLTAAYEDGKAQLPAEAADLLTFAEGAAKDTYNFATGAAEDIFNALQAAAPKAPAAKAPVAEAPAADAPAYFGIEAYAEEATKAELEAFINEQCPNGEADYTAEKFFAANEIYLRLPVTVMSMMGLTIYKVDVPANWKPFYQWAYKNNVRVDNSDFVKLPQTAVRYPMTANADKVNEALASLDKTALEMIKSLGDTDDAKKAIFCNAGVDVVLDLLANTIFPMIGNLDLGMDNSIVNGLLAVFRDLDPYKMLTEMTRDMTSTNKGIYPYKEAANALAEKIGDSDKNQGEAWDVYDALLTKYNEDLAKFEAGEIAEKPVAPVFRDIAWDMFFAEGYDWHVIPGDIDSFSQAVAFGLSAYASTISMAIKFESKQDTNRNMMIHGAYMEVNYLLECLGADSKDVEAYMSIADYNAQKGVASSSVSPSVKASDLFKPLIANIATFVDQILDAPVTGLMTVLPKLAYLLESGMLNDTVYNILTHEDFVLPHMVELDVTADGLFNMLFVDADGNPTDELVITDGVALSKDSLSKLLLALAGCGEVEAKASLASTRNMYFPNMKVDTAAAFATVYSWAQRYITADVLAPMLYNAVDEAGLPYFVSYKLYLAVYAISTLPSQPAFAVIVNLFAPALEGVVAKIIPQFSVTMVSIFDLIAGAFLK